LSLYVLAHTYQADVETVHRIIEDEFFEIESFSSRQIFLNPPGRAILPTLDLDEIFKKKLANPIKRVYHVPSFFHF